jgi:hypothetical protein
VPVNGNGNANGALVVDGEAEALVRAITDQIMAGSK